jgi:hypothetical protein
MSEFIGYSEPRVISGCFDSQEENQVLRERINRLEEQTEKQRKYITVLQQKLINLGENYFPRE